ncbi:MAG: anthranilate phosphoribosyltransferase [Methylococcaceae bacterium]|nr:MAG: anthranilate phosphoribosyltransferase [Methylococcaceae bacterium]
MMIQQALTQLLAQHDLSAADMRTVMHDIMTGQVSPAQLAAFLIALRCKGESIDEITAAAEVMRDLATQVLIQGEHIVDTCGTGGDGANTFNISTTSAFVAAAAGAQVAKHGNRSVSSHCGSADVLEAAGVNLDLNAEQVAHLVNTLGIGFLFAPKHHGAMRHTIAVRKELGVRTLFNLLGPLANPANAPNQLIGVFAQQWLNPIAEVLKKLGSQHVLVVNAEDGLDEISLATPTHITELQHGQIISYTITPEQFGLQRAPLSALTALTAQSSLQRMHEVFSNTPGAATDIVLLNAGAAIYAANLTPTLHTGIERAREVIASGAALQKFTDLITYSNT